MRTVSTKRPAKIGAGAAPEYLAWREQVCARLPLRRASALEYQRWFRGYLAWTEINPYCEAFPVEDHTTWEYFEKEVGGLYIATNSFAANNELRQARYTYIIVPVGLQVTGELGEATVFAMDGYRLYGRKVPLLFRNLIHLSEKQILQRTPFAGRLRLQLKKWLGLEQEVPQIISPPKDVVEEELNSLRKQQEIEARHLSH